MVRCHHRGTHSRPGRTTPSSTHKPHYAKLAAYERQANDYYATPRWVTELLTSTVRLRGTVWEPCGGQGAIAKVIDAAGYKVVATDLVAYEDCVFPVASGIDALHAPLPPGVRAVVTNPPYDKFLLPKLVRHWLGILNPVGGQLCLLLRVLWGECKVGQVLTTKHPAYSGKVKTPRRIQWYEDTPLDKRQPTKEEHACFLWDARRDSTRLPFDASAGDPRLLACWSAARRWTPARRRLLHELSGGAA